MFSTSVLEYSQAGFDFQNISSTDNNTEEYLKNTNTSSHNDKQLQSGLRYLKSTTGDLCKGNKDSNNYIKSSDLFIDFSSAASSSSTLPTTDNTSSLNSATEYFANIYRVFNCSDATDSSNMKYDCSRSESSYTLEKSFPSSSSFENLLNEFSNYNDGIINTTLDDSLPFSDIHLDYNQGDDYLSDHTTSGPESVQGSKSLCNSPKEISTAPLLSPKSSCKSFRRASVAGIPMNPKKNRYGCKICGKSFSRPSSLSTHINTHTGDKPFLCPFEGCSKGFNARSNMTRHFKTHFKIPTGGYLLPSGKIIHETPSLKQLAMEEL